ncbi:hypothetical protein BDV24DRAFT_144106 [Aspergillus arachidicola]|uniref:Uncharacterized protein n=1 Tax=Aspergillus arachidicola TaxID=656916 RepID=A0A5N6XQ18_9EURO|nr:hypothetical protein BDV24DRAFT_144106 [Aspergillus arachidicola]
MDLIIHHQHYSILLVPHHDHHSFTTSNPIPWIPKSKASGSKTDCRSRSPSIQTMTM